MEIMKKIALSSVAAAVALATQSAHSAVSLDPQAINLEPFRLVPVLGVQMLMDDNIYNFSANEVDSMILVVSPSVNLAAQDRDNTYTLSYGINAGFYTDESDNNYVDHALNASAGLNITSRAKLDLVASYSMLHEDLGTGATQGVGAAGIEALSGPDEYSLVGLKSALTYGAEGAAGQLVGSVGMTNKRYDRDLAADLRDLDTLDYGVGFRYRVAPKTKLTFDIERSEGSYRNSAVADTADFEQNAFMVGAVWENSAQTTGRIRLGQTERKVESGFDKSGFTYNGDVTWSPRELTRINFGLSKSFTDGTLPTTLIETDGYSVAWSQDWLERLTSTLSYSMLNEDHDRIDDVTREDETATIGARVDYQMRRWLILGGGVTSKSSESTLDTFDVDRNIFFLSAQISL
jgi:hypothetical protein